MQTFLLLLFFFSLQKCLTLSPVAAPKWLHFALKLGNASASEATRPCNLHKLRVNSWVRESRTRHLYGNYLKRTWLAEWHHLDPVIQESLRAGLGTFQVISPRDTASPRLRRWGCTLSQRSWAVVDLRAVFRFGLLASAGSENYVYLQQFCRNWASMSRYHSIPSCFMVYQGTSIA